jgi:hypothetical protein
MKAKDNGEMFDVPDSERNEALATGKFDEFYLMKSKADGEEFMVPAHELGDALKSNKFELAEVYDRRKQIEANPTKPKISKLQSALLGAGNAMSLGFADEIIGGLGGDKHSIRKTQDEAKDQNPWSYGAGGVLGGMVSPSIVGSAGKTFVTAIGKGALAGGILGGVQGVGENVNREELAGDVLKGATLGTVLGGVGGAIGRGAQAFTKAGRADLANEYQAFKQGFSESKPEVLPGINQAKKIWDGVKETLESSKAQEELFNFVKGSKLNTVSRMVEDGSIPKGQEQAYLSFFNKLSDEEYILMKLQEGDPEVSSWIARQAGGNTEAKQRFLAMRPEERQALRSMDINSEAKQLTPVAQKAQAELERDTMAKVNQSTQTARDAFNVPLSRYSEAYNSTIGDLSEMADVVGSKAIKNVELSRKIIFEGRGGRAQWGLEPSTFFGDAPSAIQFNRLQRARELVDDAIDWDAIKSGKRPPNQSEQILIDYRSSIDNILKSAPGKTEADNVFRLSKELDDMIFGKTELKGGIDPYKIKRLLSNTDEANRFRDGLSRLKEWSNSADSEARQAANEFLDKFNALFAKKKNSDALNQLQREDGPSALAIQRLQRSMRGDDKNILHSAIKETPDFLLRHESRAADMQQAIGKAYKNMTMPEKTAFNRVYLQIEKQGGIATPDVIKHNFGLELEKMSKIK